MISKSLNVHLEVFMPGEQKDNCLVQAPTISKEGLKKFRRLRKQAVIAAKKLSRRDNVAPAQMALVSRVTAKGDKLAPKLLVLWIDRTAYLCYLATLQNAQAWKKFMPSGPIVCKNQKFGKVSPFCIQYVKNYNPDGSFY